CPTAPGVGGCMTIGDHAGQGAVVYPLPEHATVHGNVAAFRYDDLPCTYTTAHNGVKLGCTVAARRGPHTYRFPYRLVGNADELTVRSDGSAANNFVVVSAPMVLGADHQLYDAGGWRIDDGQDQRLAFDFDDARLPDAAFPYVVDPTTTFNLGICCTSAAGTSCQSPIVVCTASSACTTAPYTTCAGASASDGYALSQSAAYPPGFSSCNTSSAYFFASKSFTGSVYQVHNGLVKWDTSSLPDDAVVTGATLRAYSPASSNINTDSRNVTMDWYNWDIPKVGCDSTDASSAGANNAFAGVSISSLIFDYNDFVLTDSAGFPHINVAGTTYLRLNVDGGQPTGQNIAWFGSRDNTQVAGPALIVDFDLAAT